MFRAGRHDDGRVDDAAGLAAGEGQVRDLGLGGRETRSSLNGGAQRKRGAARALIVKRPTVIDGRSGRVVPSSAATVSALTVGWGSSARFDFEVQY